MSGNPKRFQCNEVVRMGDGGVSQGGPTPRRDLAGPVEEIETEGQRQLKELLHKQLNTSITIKEQLSGRKSFVGGSAFKASTDDLSGVTSLTQFQTLGEKDAYIYELKQCGLTEEEITIKLESDNLFDEKPQRKRNYGADNSLYKDKLEEIEEKIRQRNVNLAKPDTFTDAKVLSRHEMDLERSLVKDDRTSRNLSTTLTTEAKRKVYVHPDDPMNHLPEILASVTKGGKSRKRKRKRHIDDSQDEETCFFPKERTFYETVAIQAENSKKEAQSETQESRLQIEDIASSSSSGDRLTRNVEPLVADNVDTFSKADSAMDPTIPSPSDRSCVKGGQHDHVEWVPEEDIVTNRLKPEEVKQIPRFENYSPGTESKVLYIKNLSTKVTEEDLVALFIRFQTEADDKIVFRLMSGKMKGQAFVTFPSVEKAVSAMQLVHGLLYKGKPIIIQFGRASQ